MVLDFFLKGNGIKQKYIVQYHRDIIAVPRTRRNGFIRVIDIDPLP
jgi:hypothetical protein